MEHEKIERINELARKKKTVGLTAQELETLRKTNEHLISTLEEVRQIQDEGRTRRRNAEVELSAIESELRQKLLDMKG